MCLGRGRGLLRRCCKAVQMRSASQSKREDTDPLTNQAPAPGTWWRLREITSACVALQQGVQSVRVAASWTSSSGYLSCLSGCRAASLWMVHWNWTSAAATHKLLAESFRTAAGGEEGRWRTERRVLDTTCSFFHAVVCSLFGSSTNAVVCLLFFACLVPNVLSCPSVSSVACVHSPHASTMSWQVFQSFLSQFSHVSTVFHPHLAQMWLVRFRVQFLYQLDFG